MKISVKYNNFIAYNCVGAIDEIHISAFIP